MPDWRASLIEVCLRLATYAKGMGGVGGVGGVGTVGAVGAVGGVVMHVGTRITEFPPFSPLTLY